MLNVFEVTHPLSEDMMCSPTCTPQQHLLTYAQASAVHARHAMPHHCLGQMLKEFEVKHPVSEDMMDLLPVAARRKSMRLEQ